MKVISVVLMLFVLRPCWAGDFDNPYLDFYNRIAELEQKYISARQREQSTANKLIGAVAIGAGGVGGQMLASSLAERAADESAERDMRAYLETFRCDYGAGKNIKGGQTGIELPGGNELASLRAEYAALAARVRAQKDTLGLAPGIEADVPMETTALYDNAALGKTGGAYTSVYRALTDVDGDDAAAWSEQKSKSESKTKTGAIVGGGGIGAATVGNIIESALYNKK